MARDVNAQLRITAWPAAPLPLPQAARFECSLDPAEGVIVPGVEGFTKLSIGPENAPHSWIAETPETWVTPNGETYLRLAELDLDDAEAILDFVRQYGPLGGALAHASLRSQGDFFKQHYAGQLNLRRESVKKRRALVNELIRQEPRMADVVDTKNDEWWDRSLFTTLSQIPPCIETLDEFRFAARCLRDLYSAWRMYKDGRDVTDFEWVSPSDPESFTTIHHPSVLVHGMMRAFLNGFSPQVLLSWSYPGGAQVEDLFKPADVVKIEPVRGPEEAPLYSICALELFNHIVDNAEYHICANERCRRTFVHQQGGSMKGQHRSRGVLYCSPGCARATAQREYRRRRRVDPAKA